MPLLYFYAFTLGIGSCQTTLVMTANTNTYPIFAAKFGWDKKEKVFYNTLISTVAVVGLSLGTLVGGKTMTIGRRRALIIMEVVAFIGGLIT